MFTGIIESVGTVEEVIKTGSNKIIWVRSSISNELKPDQSVSHNGVCLTVEEVRGSSHRITAIDETLQKTSLDDWQEGTVINLERSLQVNGRLDGHFVQGHVDAIGICKNIVQKQGSREITIEFPSKFAPLVIEKGSISLDGVSLTSFNVTHNNFTVAIIPYTETHTNLNSVKQDLRLNLEFDMIGKYIQRRITMENLR